MILRPLSFEEISKIFDDQAQSVIEYYLFKAIISQPELVTGQNKLPIQIPKEHIEQWGVQSLGLESIGAGSYPIDLVAKDKSFGFDFFGTYHEIKTYSKLVSTLGDGRSLEITFLDKGNEVEVIETFEAESENSIELQQQGWQAILDEFKRYVESK